MTHHVINPDVLAAMRDSMERREGVLSSSLRAMATALSPAVTRAAAAMATWGLAGSLVLDPGQSAALEAAVLRAARATMRSRTRPVRLRSARSILRALGATQLVEGHGHLAVTAGDRSTFLVLLPLLVPDRARWALALAAIARLDPEPCPELAALDTTLRAGGLVEEAPWS